MNAFYFADSTLRFSRHIHIFYSKWWDATFPSRTVCIELEMFICSKYAVPKKNTVPIFHVCAKIKLFFILSGLFALTITLSRCIQYCHDYLQVSFDERDLCSGIPVERGNSGCLAGVTDRLNTHKLRDTCGVRTHQRTTVVTLEQKIYKSNARTFIE